MRLMLAAVSAILASMPSRAFIQNVAHTNLMFEPQLLKVSPTPHGHSGVRAIKRAAAKRRNQRRSRR